MIVCIFGWILAVALLALSFAAVYYWAPDLMEAKLRKETAEGNQPLDQQRPFTPWAQQTATCDGPCVMTKKKATIVIEPDALQR